MSDDAQSFERNQAPCIAVELVAEDMLLLTETERLRRLMMLLPSERLLVFAAIAKLQAQGDADGSIPFSRRTPRGGR